MPAIFEHHRGQENSRPTDWWKASEALNPFRESLCVLSVSSRLRESTGPLGLSKQETAGQGDRLSDYPDIQLLLFLFLTLSGRKGMCVGCAQRCTL